MDKSRSRSAVKSLQEINGKLGKEELVKRLKALANVVSEMDQSSDLSQITPHAASLVQPAIINHRDKDVRLLAGCCLADVFRLYAPEAPYSDDELKSIFRLFVQLLPGVEKASSASFARSFYILESLAMVKSFVLCVELDAQEILVELFEQFFTIIKEDHSHKLQACMLDVLSSLLAEMSTIPDDLFDTILERLLEPKKTESPAAYKLARNLIARCSSHLQGLIFPYFNSMLGAKDSESPLAARAHDLLFELNNIDHVVLLHVMPLVEHDLLGEAVGPRSKAMFLAAKMFADKDSKLASSLPSLWHAFLGRFGDVDAGVRAECAQLANHIATAHPSLVPSILEKLQLCIMDVDDKVRTEVIRACCEIATTNALSFSVDTLHKVMDRRLDKKLIVRLTALRLMGRLYDKLANTADDEDEWSGPLADRIAWVPLDILKSYYIDDVDTKICVESVVDRSLLNPRLPSKSRATRFRHLAHIIKDEPHCQTAFAALLRSKRRLGEIFLAYVNSTDEEEAPPQAIIDTSPDKGRTRDQLVKLRDLKDTIVKKNLRICLTPDSDVTASVAAKESLLKKFEGQSSMSEMLMWSLTRCMPPPIDAETVALIISNCSSSTASLLQTFAQVFFHLFRSPAVAAAVVSYISGGEALPLGVISLIPVLAEHAVADSPLRSKAVSRKLAALVLTSTPKYTKQIVRAISALGETDNTPLSGVFDTLLKNLTRDSPNLLCALVGLREVSVLDPLLFNTEHKRIVVDFVVRGLLMQSTPPEIAEDKDTPEWPDTISDECAAKLAGLKLLVRRLLGREKLDSDEERAAVARPSLRLLTALVESAGELTQSSSTPVGDQSRLRLGAATSLLKLCTSAHYAKILTQQQLQQLLLTAQDSCVKVRRHFIEKLHKHSFALRLPLSFMAAFCLSAADPEPACAKLSMSFFEQNVRKRREYLSAHPDLKKNQIGILPEYVLPHLVHMLAYHPDLVNDDDFIHDASKLQTFIPYFKFFFDGVSRHAESLQLLKTLLETIKRTEDAANPAKSPNIYALCDVGLLYLSKMAERPGWKLKNVPSEMPLPAGLFVTRAAPVAPQSYLPVGFSIDLRVPQSPADKVRSTPDKKRSPTSEAKKPASRKATPSKSKLAKSPADTSTPSRRNASRVARSLGPKLKAAGKADGTDDDDDDDDDDNEKEEMEADSDSSEEATKARGKRKSGGKAASSDDADSSSNDDSDAEAQRKPASASKKPRPAPAATARPDSARSDKATASKTIAAKAATSKPSGSTPGEGKAVTPKPAAVAAKADAKRPSSAKSKVKTPERIFDSDDDAEAAKAKASERDDGDDDGDDGDDGGKSKKHSTVAAKPPAKRTKKAADDSKPVAKLPAKNADSVDEEKEEESVKSSKKSVAAAAATAASAKAKPTAAAKPARKATGNQVKDDADDDSDKDEEVAKKSTSKQKPSPRAPVGKPVKVPVSKLTAASSAAATVKAKGAAADDAEEESEEEKDTAPAKRKPAQKAAPAKPKAAVKAKAKAAPASDDDAAESDVEEAPKKKPARARR